MSSESAISVKDVAKRYDIYDNPRDRMWQFLMRGKKNYYREFWALRDVSIEIAKGETVGIIGRNGSGKSTLLQMICGTLSPTMGSIQTNGRISALLELGAGFNSEFTGRENVFLNAAILGFPRKEMEKRMHKVLAFSELGDFLDQPVKTYSSGMYARLAFSAAIHVDPQILVIDETLAVGDARFVAKCMRRLKEIQERGTTILFVSHDVGSVRTFCQRAIWFEGGRLVDQGDVFPVTGRYMEFMFQDEETEEKTLRQAIVKKNETAEVLPLVQAVPVVTDSALATNVLDERPVTHWGSHKGLILSAAVLDQQGYRRDVHEWGQAIEILISVRIPRQISREHLRVAFSIKDIKGTDLIVSTTHDFTNTLLPEQECFSISFKLTNPLTTGKYLLVAAVESRQHLDVHYYEYFEGAHYFSSLSNERLFGLFHPSIQQAVLM